MRDATPQGPARRSGLLRLRASEPGALLRCHRAQGGAPAGAWVPHRGNGRRGVSGEGGVLLQCNRNEPEGAAPRRRAGVLLQCNRNEPEGAAPSEDFGVACAALGPAGGRATRPQTGTRHGAGTGLLALAPAWQWSGAGGPAEAVHCDNEVQATVNHCARGGGKGRGEVCGAQSRWSLRRDRFRNGTGLCPRPSRDYPRSLITERS